MSLVQEVSLAQAKANVQNALVGISDEAERAVMAVALMQLQEAMERVEQRSYAVARREGDQIVQSDVVYESELEWFIATEYHVNIHKGAVLSHIHEHDSYVVPCLDKGTYFDLLIEPYNGE